MSKLTRIAIDGPGGAGKSTVAKLIAKKLGFEYIDTGAMYRAVGLKFAREIKEGNIKVVDKGLAGESDIKMVLDHTEIDFINESIYLDGENVDESIRSADAAMMASKYSAVPLVREKLVELQRQIASSKNVVMDGRDIGTNVIPDAQYKFFVTASLETRAQRRMLELEKKGQTVDYNTIHNEIAQRDKQDRERKLNPLVQAEDAVLVDTTSMTIEEVVDFICKKMI